MIEIVWEFVLKEHYRGVFELAYGPGGAWSKLFSDCPGFRGTTVMRDVKDPRRYLVVDLWDTGAQRDQALRERETGYADMQVSFDQWTETRREVGVFNVLAQATVRPRRSGQSKTKKGRRRY